jgi:hypothetical protein
MHIPNQYWVRKQRIDSNRRKFFTFLITVNLSLMANSVWSEEVLTLTTPNDKQQWKTGETYTIRWNKGSTEAGSHVKIQLLRRGKPYKIIKAKTKNDGKHRWKVPSSVKSGKGYQIKITSTAKKSVSDLSNKRFSITDGSLLLAAGDISECKNNNSAKTAKIIERYPTATVATMGDNAYKDGSKKDFECYDRTWGKFKDRTNPTLGNHEYRTTNASGYFRYFGKRAGQRGKGYYSYKLGSWTIVALNTVPCVQNRIDHPGGCTKDSLQYQWLKETLSQSKSKCALAYMHHPWVSSGVHGRTAAIRPIVDLLYEHGVDVVLSGHDHIYERLARQSPDGRLDNQRGMRQFVVGTGGRELKTQEKLRNIDKPLKNSETRSRKTHGVLKLDLREDSYQWEFIAVKEHKFSDEGIDLCH